LGTFNCDAVSDPNRPYGVKFFAHFNIFLPVLSV
jgi:hypothetical protein